MSLTRYSTQAAAREQLDQLHARGPWLEHAVLLSEERKSTENLHVTGTKSFTNLVIRKQMVRTNQNETKIIKDTNEETVVVHLSGRHEYVSKFNNETLAYYPIALINNSNKEYVEETLATRQDRVLMAGCPNVDMGNTEPMDLLEVFPILKHYEDQLFPNDHRIGNQELTTLAPWLHALEGTDDFTEFVELMFGSQQRDLIKAVANAQLYDIAVAHLLYDRTMPADWVVAFLNNMDSHQRSLVPIDPELFMLDSRSRRRLLSRFSPARDSAAYELLHVTFNKANRMEIDTVKCDNWNDLFRNVISYTRAARLTKVTETDLKQQHREGARLLWLQTDYGIEWQAMRDREEALRLMEQREAEQRREEENKKKFARRHEMAEYLTNILTNKMKFGDFSIVVADSNEKLQEWSNEMSNCIKGYTRDREEYSSVFCGLYKAGSDDVKVNIQIRIDEDTNSYSVVQALAAFNKEWPGDSEFKYELSQLVSLR